jgi:hypothetical protein
VSIMADLLSRDRVAASRSESACRRRVKRACPEGKVL